ncbi:hypothetical protein [Bacillus haynesii]|uniref:hypothetical protein n=1 Tax=Bacillus haynesii TaxID=1925021 RepID=UPI0022819261|nr:hypothetical protein [Bacillus haynesii]MCY8074254.1 hypothetical protein [Bacillus haynesii]MCY8383182.1 hypothetical protein [Bacillus haynesii]MCY8539712.1 hypothetical protein [Bacillus haynesii]MCY9225728.1 hypothetical protein [Bacillus haynesii]
MNEQMTEILSEARRGIREILEHGFKVKEIKLRPDVKKRLVRDHLLLFAIGDDEEGEKTEWTLFGYPVDAGVMKEDFKIEFGDGTHVLELGPDEEIVKAHSYTHDGLIMVSYQVVRRKGETL